jgi:hypothetical protein
MKTLKALLCLLFLSISVNTRAQVAAVAGAGAFALAFNDLADRLNGLIQQFQNAGLVLEVNAGSQVSAVLNNVKGVYEDELKNTASTMSAQEQALISNLGSLVDNLKKNELDPLTAQIQTISNTLPFANKFPQITSISGNILQPYFGTPKDSMNSILSIRQAMASAGAVINAGYTLVRDNVPDTIYTQTAQPAQQVGSSTNIAFSANSSNHQYKITIKGNFIDIGNKGFDATLTVHGKSYLNIEKSTNTISFVIPAEDLGSASNQVFYLPFSIHIPYNKKKALIFDKKTFTDFSFQFIKLPSNAGFIEIQTTQPGGATVFMYVTCTDNIWDSSQDYKDEIHGCNMADGWSCDRNTVNCIFTRKEGDQNNDWFDLGNASTPTYVGWHFKTLHKRFGTSGKLTVNFHYKEYKPVNINYKATTGLIPLQWGESKVFNIASNETFAIIYHQFDGKIYQYSSNVSNNPYLTVQANGSNLQINTMPQ